MIKHDPALMILRWITFRLSQMDHFLTAMVDQILVDIRNQSITATEKDLHDIAQQIETTFLAMSKEIDAELCNERLTKLKYQRIELTAKLEQLKKDQPQPLAIDPLKARAFFLDIRNIYNAGTNEQKRTLFKTYIRNMILDPENGQVNVVFYPHYLQKTIESGNGSPLNISSGAGSGA